MPQPANPGKTEPGWLARITATIINGMRPQTIGRAFGIGLRVAGRIATQRLGGAAETAQARGPAGSQAQVGAAVQAGGQAGVRAGRGIVQGMGGFLRPFRRVGGILWLEVTGVFFLLPVLVFGPTAWRTRMSWAQGPDHRTFVVSLIVAAIFLYLGVSSFWRARRR